MESGEIVDAINFIHEISPSRAVGGSEMINSDVPVLYVNFQVYKFFQFNALYWKKYLVNGLRWS